MLSHAVESDVPLPEVSLYLYRVDKTTRKSVKLPHDDDVKPALLGSVEEPLELFTLRVCTADSLILEGV
jgi:hypothetical protein